MHASNEWQEWVASAEEDLLNIRNNIASLEVPWNVVCFHAQLATEKHLKALLILNEVKPSLTHDRLLLLARCIRHHPDLQACQADCILLNQYGVASRYPGPRPATGEEGRQAAELAKNVISHVKQHLPA